MDPDLHEIIDFLHSAARSVGAEVTSPWFYLQLGLVLGDGVEIVLDDAVARMMAVNAEDRFQSPQMVMKALEPFLKEETREQLAISPRPHSVAELLLGHLWDLTLSPWKVSARALPFSFARRMTAQVSRIWDATSEYNAESGTAFDHESTSDGPQIIH